MSRRVQGASVLALVAVGLLVPSPAHAQEDAPPALQVGGAVAKPLRLSLEDLAKLPRVTVQVQEREGQEVEYEGVAVHEILRRAGATLGEHLRGDAIASYVVVGAFDGYQAVFALAELDPSFRDRVALLADQCNGQPLSITDGPLRLVVPDEKRITRWVRMVETVTVHQVPPLEK